MGDPSQMVSEADCRTILDNFLHTKNHQLKSFKVTRFPKMLEGLIGEHFTLQLDFEHNHDVKTQKFFVKTLSNNKLMVELAKTVMVYEKEAFYYTYLMPEFEKIHIDVSFAPRGYFFVPYITVLQDLTVDGYCGTKRREPLDLEHCKICLEALAKFHASGIIYQRKKGDILGRKFVLGEEFPGMLEDKFFSQEDNGATRWLRCSINGVFKLIDLIPENHIKREEFSARLAEALEELTAEKDPVDYPTTILHGDLWSSNFLYLYNEEGKPTTAKLVDYQTTKYGPVQVDLMQFMMTNTRRQFRDKNFNGLMAHYHGKLSEILHTSGLDLDEILPLAKLIGSCEDFKLGGKMHAIVDRSLTFMEDAVLQKALATEESFRIFLFEERAEAIMKSYTTNKDYQEVLEEDVVELRDLLFAV